MHRAVAGQPESTDAERGPLGVRHGQVVQEFGYDTDCDDELRDAIEAATGSALEGEDFGEVVDVALVWWREDDGDTQDLADLLTDALVTLEDGGLVWLLAPKAGRDGHVLPAEVEEGATTAGLHVTSTISAAPTWSGFRLTSRGRGR